MSFDDDDDDASSVSVPASVCVLCLRQQQISVDANVQ